MKNKLTAVIFYICVFVLIVVLGAFGASIWLAKGQMTPLKEKVFSKIPFPMAFVNNKPIYMSDFLQRYESAKAFYAKNPEIKDEGLKKSLADKMIEEEKIRQVAGIHGVSVSNNEINREYEIKSKTTDLEGKTDFASLLKSYGMTESEYKKQMIKPDLLTAKLVIWYNQQQILNKEAYAKASEVQRKLDAGENFGSLAKAYSQDSSGKASEGDMGFVLTNDLLPELQESLDSMQPGQTKLVVSRYGLHVVKMEEKDNKGQNNAPRAHVRQIFFKTVDFDKWYQNETHYFHIKKIIKT